MPGFVGGSAVFLIRGSFFDLPIDWMRASAKYFLTRFGGRCYLSASDDYTKAYKRDRNVLHLLLRARGAPRGA